MLQVLFGNCLPKDTSNWFQLTSQEARRFWMNWKGNIKGKSLKIECLEKDF